MRKTGFVFLLLALHFLIHLPLEKHACSPLYYKAYGSGSNKRQDKIPLPFRFFAGSTVVPGRLEQDLLGGKKKFTSSNWIDTGPANSSEAGVHAVLADCSLVNAWMPANGDRPIANAHCQVWSPSWKSRSDIVVNKQKSKPKNKTQTPHQNAFSPFFIISDILIETNKKNANKQNHTR